MATAKAKAAHRKGHDAIALLTEEMMEPGDDHFDAKVTVLGEYIEHHVKEEHEEMFPKARKAKVDIAALGERMARRRTELQDGFAQEQ